MDKVQIIALSVIIISIILYIIWLIRKNQLKDTAIRLIVQAEKRMQDGDEKMEYCIKEIAKLIPAPFNFFITENTIRSIIQSVFDKIKIALDYQKPININKTMSETIVCEPVENIENIKIGGSE